MMAFSNPTAVIFSSPNILADELAKNLKNKNCSVDIIGPADKFPESADYVFLLEGLNTESRAFARQDFKRIFNFIKLTSPKGALILPFITPDKFTGSIDIAQKEFFALEGSGMNLIFAGELYGIGMDLAMPGIVAQTFSGLSSGQVKVPQVDLTVFPAYAPAAAEKIVRGVFSYGFEKDKVVLADKISAFSFIRKVKEFSPGIVFERDRTFRKPSTVPVFKFLNLSESDESIRETVNWARRERPDLAVKKPNIKVRKVNLPKVKIKRKKILIGIVAAFWIISLPFLTILGSFAFGSLAVGAIRRGSFASGESLVNASLFLSTLSRSQFQFLGRVPLVGSAFKFPYEISKALEEGGQLGKRGIESIRNLKSIAEGVLTDKDFDLKSSSSKLYLELDEIYNKLSFLEAELKSVHPIEVGSLKGYVLAGRDLAGQLSVLLGQQGETAYLILLQDEREVRPTGGLISVFALATFDAGKLTDITVYDARSTDSQLRGRVEPPSQIKNYLGEEGWTLGNSNWDPDFVASSAKAEWFLEKEIDRHVDGVVGLDFAAVKKITGVNIDPADLTASASDAMDKLRNPEVLFSALKVLPDLINEKHVQIFFHDKKAQEAGRLIGGAGEASYEACSGNCADIWTGLVEANLGGNKVNQAVTRQASLESAVKGQFIENKMTVTLKNGSLKENYRTFIRALASTASVFNETAIRGLDGVRSLTTEVSEMAGRVEGGVLVEVPPSSAKIVTFSWRTSTKANLGKPGKAYIYFRKQAGVSSYPVSVNLTHKSKLLYNTTLTRDFETESAWK